MFIEYALDTYSVFNFNDDEIFNQFARSGRFITAIVGKFVKNISMSEEVAFWLSNIFAIIFAILSILKIYTLIKRDVKFLKILIPLLIIINPFSIELFLYIENSIMWLGVFLCICAGEQTVKYFQNKNKANIALACIFMFLANCCYQGVIGIYVLLSLVFILKYSKNIKDFIKNNIIVALIYGMPAFLNFALIKIIYNSNRLNGTIIPRKSMEIIFENIDQMSKYTYDLLPKNLFLLCIAFTFVILGIKFFKEKRYASILCFLYIIIGGLLVTIAPQIIQPTNSIWFVARSTYPFATLYGVLLLYIVLNCKMDKITIGIIITLSITLLTFQFKTFATIIKDRYIVNEKDYEVSMQIIDRIKKYEQSTGKEITKIQIYKDMNPQYTYNGIFSTGDINIKAYSTDWSTVSILEYYLKRKIKQVEIDSNLQTAFSEKDWDDFYNEQVDFKEETLILCRY